MNSFAQRVVLITGAVGNLGSAIAHAFQLAGARTVLIDRSADRLHHHYPDLVMSSDHLLLGGVDLTNEASVMAAVASTIDRFGRVDVLVNTVGAWRGGQPTKDAPLADWEFLHSTNVIPAVLTARAVIPHFLTQRSGKIINIAARSA